LTGYSNARGVNHPFVDRLGSIQMVEPSIKSSFSRFRLQLCIVADGDYHSAAISNLHHFYRSRGK
jgi:hypothetical protein